MPEVGESDMGLFALRRRPTSSACRRYAQQAAAARGTGERNFLPFIPWLGSRARGRHVPWRSTRIEAVGVNTPAELDAVERYLARRGSRTT